MRLLGTVGLNTVAFYHWFFFSFSFSDVSGVKRFQELILINVQNLYNLVGCLLSAFSFAIARNKLLNNKSYLNSELVNLIGMKISI